MNQLDELRDIIVGDSAQQLEALVERIENVEKRTKDVAEVLSPAIDQQGDKLAESLQKPVSLGLKRAIRSEPKEYAEILYPVMAPSIRRAIAQAISSMLVTINRTIESATTVQGLSLRYQSIRTGIPYAELALRNSVLYRVEHVYLIHRETGLAIEALHAEGIEAPDSDAVSAMFSAIQSFVQDSFSKNESGLLSGFNVGERNVWVANGPQTMLACVIRGDAPESLKTELYNTLDTIRTQYGNSLVDFNGDVSPFDGIDLHLQPLLLSELKEPEPTTHSDGKKPMSMGAAILTALLIFGSLFMLVRWTLGKSDIATVEHFLRDTPGVAATDVYWSDGKLLVEGLKDPDAIIPYETLKTYGIERDSLVLNMIPFRSLEVNMEIQRFRNELDLPPGVELLVQDGEILLKGRAPLIWLNSKGARLQQLAADRRLSVRPLAATHNSVSKALQQTLPYEAIKDLRLSDVQDKIQTTVLISGSTDLTSLTLLRSLFAANDWVDVTAIPQEAL